MLLLLIVKLECTSFLNFKTLSEGKFICYNEKTSSRIDRIIYQRHGFL